MNFNHKTNLSKNQLTCPNNFLNVKLPKNLIITFCNDLLFCLY